MASVVGLAGIAAATSFIALRGSSETLTTKLPADTDVVVTAYLDPAASQKVNLFRLTSAFPSLGDEATVTGRAGDGVDSMLQATGLRRDDLGWVGSQVAVAVDVRPEGMPAIAMLLDATNEADAEASLRTLRGGPLFVDTKWTQEDHGDVHAWVGDDGYQQTYVGIVDGTVAIANDAQVFDGIVATANGSEPSLADDQNFVDTMAGLPESRLGMLYVAPGDLLALVDRMRGPGVADLGTAAGVDPAAVRGIGAHALGRVRLARAGFRDHDRPLEAHAGAARRLRRRRSREHPADDGPRRRARLHGAGTPGCRSPSGARRPAAGSARGARPERAATRDRLAHGRPGAGALEAAGRQPPAGALMVGTGDEQAMTAALQVAAKTLSEGLVTDGAPSSAWKTVDTAA